MNDSVPAIRLPLPEPLETLIDELGKHVRTADPFGILGEQAEALVRTSRQARQRLEESLKSISITFAFAEPSLTDAELAEMRRRTDAATKGPWETTATTGYPEDVHMRGPKVGGYEGELWRREDGEFVAHARTDMVRLLDEIDRLRNPPPPLAPSSYVSPSTERPDGR